MKTTFAMTTLLSSAAAFAGPMPFMIFENADSVVTDHLHLGVEAFDAGGSIDFVLTNASAGPGVITSLLIENSTVTSGLTFSELIGPDWSAGGHANPPGSIDHSTGWAGTFMSFRADPSPVHNGLDAGDSLTLRFDLNGASFADAYEAFANSDFHFVAHIQAIGASSVWGVNVPTPASALMLGMAGIAASWRRR
tara:strand:- start:409 stop:990 length:582 start_codon:yes stop_codon:yes gene_type:complete